MAVAREICLRLLTERARTRQELAQALRKRGVPDEAAGMVLERFDEVGLIDDAAFAGQWVRSRHTRRGLARRAIAVELRRKGVADEVAQQALAEVDTAAEEHQARELVDRKLRTIPADTPERRVRLAGKLVGMLAVEAIPAASPTAWSVRRSPPTAPNRTSSASPTPDDEPTPGRRPVADGLRRPSAPRVVTSHPQLSLRPAMGWKCGHGRVPGRRAGPRLRPDRAGPGGAGRAGQGSGRRSTCTSPGNPPTAESSARNLSSVARNAPVAWLGRRSAREASATVR